MNIQLHDTNRYNISLRCVIFNFLSLIDQAFAYRRGRNVQTPTFIMNTSSFNGKLSYMVGNDVAVLDGIFRYPWITGVSKQKNSFHWKIKKVDDTSVIFFIFC